MELGNVVRFSSHPKPFLVTVSYCSNPDCLCNEVDLTFTEIGDSGEQLPHAVSFDARVDLETWQENDPPQRSPEVSGWVREFLAQCPPSRRAEFKTCYEEAKRVAKRIAEYTIDPDDVLAGQLVSFADVLSEGGSLSEGGFGYTYRLVHRGREYLVIDQYCPNPDCDCQVVHVEFYESVSPHDGGDSGTTIFQRFRGKVTLDGCAQVVERASCSLAEAKRVLSAWWKEHRNDLPMLQDRYQEVKEIGQRNLDALPTHPARTGALLADSELLSELPEEIMADGPPERIRVGRNAPCPCGSGKKYKKCCWRKDNQTEFGRDRPGFP